MSVIDFTDTCQDVLSYYHKFYKDMLRQYAGLRHTIILEKELFYPDNVANALLAVKQFKQRFSDLSIDRCIELLTEQQERLKALMDGENADIAELAHEAAPYLVKAYNAASVKIVEPTEEEAKAYEEAWQDERSRICGRRTEQDL